MRLAPNGLLGDRVHGRSKMRCRGTFSFAIYGDQHGLFALQAL
jgi:hypothetical protein